MDILATLGISGLTAAAVGGCLTWLGRVAAERIANKERQAREEAVATLRVELSKNKARLDAKLQRTVHQACFENSHFRIGPATVPKIGVHSWMRLKASYADLR